MRWTSVLPLIAAACASADTAAPAQPSAVPITVFFVDGTGSVRMTHRLDAVVDVPITTRYRETDDYTWYRFTLHSIHGHYTTSF